MRESKVRRSAFIAALLALLMSTTVLARPRPARPAAQGRAARSLGLPFEGRMVGGVLLRESRTMRYTPEYAPTGNFYGTPDLVGMLHRAS